MSKNSLEISEIITALKNVQTAMWTLHPSGQSVQLYVQYIPKRIELRLWPCGDFILTFPNENDLNKKMLLTLKPQITSVQEFEVTLRKNPEIKKFFSEWVASLQQSRIKNGKELAKVLSTL